VRADVVLDDPPVALAVRNENAAVSPIGEVVARLLRGVGQGQMHDVVRAAREVARPRLVVDHVVRRGYEPPERPRPVRVVAERSKRPDRGHAWSLVIETIEAAAAWVDRVGLALLFPKADVVLPSLWREVNGSEDENWAVREPDGTFVR